MTLHRLLDKGIRY